MNHSAANWMERLLGVPAEPDEGAAWSIQFAWPWPSWAAVVVLAAAALFVVGIYLRSGGRASRRCRLALAAIRLGLVALAMLMIAQVSLLVQRIGLPYVAVLIDDSRSMTAVDQYGEKTRKAVAERLKAGPAADADGSRWGLLQALLNRNNGELLRGIAEDHNLEVDYLTGIRPSRRHDVPGIIKELASVRPTGDSTRLGGGIRGVLDRLRGATPAAIVLLTDGINTEGPTLAEAAQDARRGGVPLFFVGFGGGRPAGEIRLSNLLADDVVFVDDAVNLELSLTTRGLEGRKLSVVLQEKGKPGVLARTVVTAAADGRPQQVRMSLRPREPGQFEYVIAAEPQDGAADARPRRPADVAAPRAEREDFRALGPGRPEL